MKTTWAGRAASHDIQRGSANTSFCTKSSGQTGHPVQSEGPHPSLRWKPLEPFKSQLSQETALCPTHRKAQVWYKKMYSSCDLYAPLRSLFNQPFAHTITTSKHCYGVTSFIATTRHEASVEAAAAVRYSPRRGMNIYNLGPVRETSKQNAFGQIRWLMSRP